MPHAYRVLFATMELGRKSVEMWLKPASISISSSAHSWRTRLINNRTSRDVANERMRKTSWKNREHRKESTSNESTSSEPTGERPHDRKARGMSHKVKGGGQSPDPVKRQRQRDALTKCNELRKKGVNGKGEPRRRWGTRRDGELLPMNSYGAMVRAARD